MAHVENRLIALLPWPDRVSLAACESVQLELGTGLCRAGEISRHLHFPGDLQRQGLIRHRRADISVLDRVGLEAAACSCYAADRRAHEAMVG